MKHYVSLCAVMKNEGPYIEEWLLYHTLLGVEHFYLFDNGSSDGTVEKVKRFNAIAGNVTLRIHLGFAAQRHAYAEGLALAKGETRWLGFIDIDEFLVVKQNKTLREFLSQYEKYIALGIHWRLYGSNGHRTFTDVPVVARFTHAQNNVNRHIKSFVHPEYQHTFVTAHKFKQADGLFTVDENCTPIPPLESIPEGGTFDKAQLNHYAVKSYEECAKRRAQPRADSGAMRDMDTFFPEHDRNDVEDLSALEFFKSKLTDEKWREYEHIKRGLWTTPLKA